MEADVDASLGALKAAIERQLGIMADQQRLIVLGEQSLMLIQLGFWA